MNMIQPATLTSLQDLSALRMATRPAPSLPEALSPQATNDVSRAEEVREAFANFVGQTFFGQMIKAMRSVQGEPAYFHGGQAEEVFTSQLDQTLAEYMTEASADRFAEPMFARQFPSHAAELDSPRGANDVNSLHQLDHLRRR